MNGSDYKKLVRPHLTQARFQHSVNVAEAAVRLAERYGADPKKAETAGILHDIMKETPLGEQLKILEASGIILTNVERSAPKLWHAMSGAAYLERVLSVRDPEILNAVRYHTTGRASMSLLEKIIFIADFISAERDYDGVEELRRAAETGLDDAMLAGVVFTIKDLAGMRKPIHPDTIAAYNDIVLSHMEAGNQINGETVVTE